MNESRINQINKYWSDKEISKCMKKFLHLWDLIPDDVLSILDVGGGIGGFACSFPGKRKLNYMLVDVSEDAIVKAKHNNIEAIQYDIDNKPLPFQDSSFDLVIASDVLEHMQNPWAVLAEMARVTKKYVLIYGPNFSYWKCRMDLLFGNPIRQMSADNYGAVKNKNGLHIDHINFITYKNIIHWSNKLGLRVLRSEAFWYRRYTLLRWFLEPFFKNWGEVYRILIAKENNKIIKDDINFSF